MATGTTCALIVVVSTFAFAAGLHGETQDLPGDECNEPGCSQNAMQLRVLKRYTETATNDCQDLQDITEGAAAAVCLSDFSCFSFCPCFDTDSTSKRAWRFLDILSGRGPTSEGVCKQEVAWARETGIQQHPEWYPGLSVQSRLMACRGCFADRGDVM